ncbi:hypothetical protein QQF64_036277 [Cirrhinus molitorella]|uniref:PiggyBac transposable element-derived protein domain-containing protein n=1 Tax=Cirrhinus molitorella TaxID=172907 RepID=A0ABR3NIA4_9TELE
MAPFFQKGSVSQRKPTQKIAAEAAGVHRWLIEKEGLFVNKDTWGILMCPLSQRMKEKMMGSGLKCMCWTTTGSWGKWTSPVPSLDTTRKFLNITNTLHLSDLPNDEENEKKKGTAAYDRLGKINPLFDNIGDACRTFSHPNQNISIEERMVASNEKSGLKQYMEEQIN